MISPPGDLGHTPDLKKEGMDFRHQRKNFSSQATRDIENAQKIKI